MRLVLIFVCLGMVLHTLAQNTGVSSDFDFGLFGNSGVGGAGPVAGGIQPNLAPGLVSANPTTLGNNGGLQQNVGMTGMTQGMQNGMQNPMLNQNQGMMNGQTGLNQNMNNQVGMMNPTGMPIGGRMQNGMMQNGMMQNTGLQNGMMRNGIAQNGMMRNGIAQNGMMQNGMVQNGMMQNGMAQNGLMQNGMAQNGLMQNSMTQNGMMQNGMQNGMIQNGLRNSMVNSPGMNFLDPTRMGRFNGNNLNQLGFDPNSQANLFQNQLNAQNMPRFGQPGLSQQTSFGQGQFGQQFSPFGQQMQHGRPFGAQFGSQFTSQPGFGMFQDPMMNAFAPNPFQMTRMPMMGMGPMGSVFMPGMEMSSNIFDANGNMVGTSGTGLMQTTGGLSQMGGLAQGNGFMFPQATQSMMPMAQGIGLPGGFGSTTITANPGLLGMGQFIQNQGLMQGGLMTQTPGLMQGLPTNSFGGRSHALRPQIGNARFAIRTLQAIGNPLNMQASGTNSNTRMNMQAMAGNMQASGTNSNARMNSFALNNNGMPIHTNIEPFSGIVPHKRASMIS